MREPPPVPLVLDVDTGVDDALAILLAARSSALRLLAITCVAGNAPVQQVATNTLRVLEILGVDVPVAVGAAGALGGAAVDTVRTVHGLDGMADLGLGPPTREPPAEPAVDLLWQLISTADRPVTLVALGPLTNLAALISAHREVVELVERVVVCGGAVSDSMPSATDFNLRHDPAAAAIVLGSDLSLTLYSVDVFGRPTVTPDEITFLLANPDPVAQLGARLLRHQLGRGNGRARIGDAGAVAAVASPDGLAVVRRENSDVAVDIDADACVRLVLSALGG